MYLRRMDTNASVYDPYALEVAPYASVDQRDFYTLSVRGMTHYLDGVSADFASEWGGGTGGRAGGVEGGWHVVVLGNRKGRQKAMESFLRERGV